MPPKRKRILDYIEKYDLSQNDEAKEFAKSLETEELGELGKLVKISKEVIDETEKTIAKIKKVLEITSTVILDKMEDESIATFELPDGGKIAIRDNIRGIVEDGPKFMEYLLAKGDETLGLLQLSPDLITPAVKKLINRARPDQVKVVVQWNSFQKYLRDNCDPLSQKTWPDGVTVNYWQDIVLRKK